MSRFFFALLPICFPSTYADQACQGSECPAMVNSLLQAGNRQVKQHANSNQASDYEYVLKGNGWCTTIPGSSNGRIKLAVDLFQNRGVNRADYGMDLCEEQCDQDPFCIGYVTDKNIPACSKMSPPWEYAGMVTATSPDEVLGVDTNTNNYCWVRQEKPQAAVYVSEPDYVLKGNGWCTTMPGSSNGRIKLAVDLFQNRGINRADYGMDLCEEQCDQDPECIGYVTDKNIPACSKMSPPWEYAGMVTATSPDEILGVDTNTNNYCWVRREMPAAAAALAAAGCPANSWSSYVDTDFSSRTLDWHGGWQDIWGITDLEGLAQSPLWIAGQSWTFSVVVTSTCPYETAFEFWKTGLRIIVPAHADHTLIETEGVLSDDTGSVDLRFEQFWGCGTYSKETDSSVTATYTFEQPSLCPQV